MAPINGDNRHTNTDRNQHISLQTDNNKSSRMHRRSVHTLQRNAMPWPDEPDWLGKRQGKRRRPVCAYVRVCWWLNRGGKRGKEKKINKRTRERERRQHPVVTKFGLEPGLGKEVGERDWTQGCNRLQQVSEWTGELGRKAGSSRPTDHCSVCDWEKPHAPVS